MNFYAPMLLLTILLQSFLCMSMHNKQALILPQKDNPKKYFLKDNNDIPITFLVPFADDIKIFFPRKKTKLSPNNFDAIRLMSIKKREEKNLIGITKSEMTCKSLLPKDINNNKPRASVTTVKPKKTIPLQQQEKYLQKLLYSKLAVTGQVSLFNKLNKMLQSLPIHNKIQCFGDIEAFFNTPHHLIIIKLTETWVSMCSLCKHKIKYLEEPYEKIYDQSLEKFVDQHFGCFRCESLSKPSRNYASPLI